MHENNGAHKNDSSLPLGHNRIHAETAQWQTPHEPHHHHHHHEDNISDEKKDLDLVEKAFQDGFHNSEDPTSFLRLAGVPFEALSENGSRMHLLRVETRHFTDVGSLTPHMGGGTFNYSPLPARMVSKRDDLAFVYSSDGKIVNLSLEQAKSLKPLPDQELD